MSAPNLEGVAAGLAHIEEAIRALESAVLASATLNQKALADIALAIAAGLSRP